MLLSSRVRLGSARPAASSRTSSVICQAAAVEAKPSKAHPSPLSQAAPSNYAVIEVGGSQLFVEPGKWYTVNRLKADVGSKIKFGRVLLHKNQDKVAVGQPYLEQVNVEAEILEELRGPKIIVYKMKPKKTYRRKNGHRQELTKFQVTSISA